MKYVNRLKLNENCSFDFSIIVSRLRSRLETGCKKTRIFVKEKKKRKNERENKKYRVKQFIEWQRMQCKQIEFIELRPQLSHQFIALKGNEREEREGWRTLNENSLCFRFR